MSQASWRTGSEVKGSRERVMDVSIVTSLYASRRHLAGFLERLEACIRSVEACGCSAESIIVSNAPDRSERRTLRAAFDSPWWHDHGKLIVVPRETLYASWNRGLRVSLGSAIAFWNVDDYRNPAAIVEGIELIRRRHVVVRFPWLYIEELEPARSGSKRRIVFYDRGEQSRLDPQVDFCLGPFFMFHRGLFEQFGPFDEQFHIAGDYDWQLRVVPHTGLHWGNELAGVFVKDGTNLCGTGSPRALLERNVVFERHGLDRPSWLLDDRAQELFATYRIPTSTDSGVTRNWSYDRRWRRRQAASRIYHRCRQLAATPIRLMRSWIG